MFCDGPLSRGSVAFSTTDLPALAAASAAFCALVLPVSCASAAAFCLAAASSRSACALLWRRKLNLKAEVESSVSHFSFKRFVPGGFNLGFIGSTCTPYLAPAAAQLQRRGGLLAPQLVQHALHVRAHRLAAGPSQAALAASSNAL